MSATEESGPIARDLTVEEGGRRAPAASAGTRPFNAVDGRPARILMVCTRLSPLPAAFAVRLHGSGFSVAAVSPDNSFLAAAPLDLWIHYRKGGVAGHVERAIGEFQPDIIVPCDDFALVQLQEMGGEVAALITQSLGDPAFFPVTRSKSRLVAMAAELGLSVPQTRIIATAEDAAAALAEFGGSVFVKADGSYGGLGVLRARSVGEVMAFVAEARRPVSWAQAVKTWLREGHGLAFEERRQFQPPVMTVQQVIDGYPANRAVLCAQGRVVAGVTVRVQKSMPNNGPACIIETIQHPQIERETARLVEVLGLTGFHGFDFMIDGAGRSWLLELNARVTPASCLFAESASPLVGALHRVLTGEDTPVREPDAGQRVVLFPQELQRDPTSAVLVSHDHHVPWTQPKFIHACLNRTLIPTPYERLRGMLRGAR